MPHTVNMRCKRAASTPTGFQDNEPVTLGFINSISTDPLA